MSNKPVNTFNFLTDKSKTLLNFNEQLRVLVESVFDNKFQYRNLKQAFLAYSFGKAYKTHASILILCKHGCGQDAAMLARSLFELAVTTLYILKDPTECRVQRWFDYDWVVRDKMYSYAKSEKRFADALKLRADSPQEGDNSIEQIARMAAKMQEKYKYKRRGWSDKTIKKMAKEVGLYSAYMTIYNLLCDLQHSGVRTVNDYFKLEGGDMRADTGPSDRWIKETLACSFHFFGIIVDKWSEQFKLGLDGKLKKLTDRWEMEIGGMNKNEVEKD